MSGARMSGARMTYAKQRRAASGKRKTDIALLLLVLAAFLVLFIAPSVMNAMSGLARPLTRPVTDHSDDPTKQDQMVPPAQTGAAGVAQ